MDIKAIETTKEGAQFVRLIEGLTPAQRAVVVCKVLAIGSQHVGALVGGRGLVRAADQREAHPVGNTGITSNVRGSINV